MGAGRERCILIISSSIDIQKIARLSLEMSVGWTVITVSSVSEGIALSATARPDVILLDAERLDTDEFAALQQLRNDGATQHSPAIVMASRVRLSQERQFRQLGATAVISKPFNPADLAQQITAALGW